MASASDIVGEIIKALEAAGSDALAVSLPEARIVEVSKPLARRWGCGKPDLTGAQLSQAEGSVLQTRYIDADLTDTGTRGATRLEITYRPADGEPSTQRFTPQLFREGAEEFLLLIAPATRGAGSSAAAEAWRALALGAEGWAAWDYDLAAQKGETAPEIPELLGLEQAAASPSFLALDARAHPEDASATMSARLGEFSEKRPVVQSRYRLRHRDGSWRPVEAKASLMRDPASGHPVRVVGLLREAAAALDARDTTPAASAAPSEIQFAQRVREASDRLTGDVARDFRLLLAGAHGNLRLAEESKDPDEIRARIRTVIEALERGVDLTNRLIDFSQEAPSERPLPAPESEAPAVAAPFPDSAVTSPAVLIVEDNDQVREVAIAMVEGIGYPVAGASSGKEALEVLSRRPDIRLLLSDVVMSGMMGPELVHQALEIRPELKVLFASGYSGEAIEGVENIPQVVDLISKPFTREELTEKVRKAMAEAMAA